ncbi:MAG: SH3 domain-containing protein, partial [Treponema sp.]|nr:SH3 domain-containing protein [Treponema sp.]
MKKSILVLFMCLMLINAFANEKYENNKYFCTTDRLKLRENPGLDSKVITVLDKLTAVEFLQEGEVQIITEMLPSTEVADLDDNWIKVKTIPAHNNKSVTGWVYGGYVTPLLECEAFSDSKAKCLCCNFYKVTNRTSGETNETYYFLENGTNIFKTLTLLVDAHDGPNWAASSYLFPRIENNKKYLYVSTESSSDTFYSDTIVRYDMTDYKNPAWQESNSKYIESIRKEYVSNYIHFSSGKEERFHVSQKTPLYKEHSFDSEIIASILP